MQYTIELPFDRLDPRTGTLEKTKGEALRKIILEQFGDPNPLFKYRIVRAADPERAIGAPLGAGPLGAPSSIVPPRPLATGPSGAEPSRTGSAARREDMRLQVLVTINARPGSVGLMRGGASRRAGSPPR